MWKNLLLNESLSFLSPSTPTNDCEHAHSIWSVIVPCKVVVVVWLYFIITQCNIEATKEAYNLFLFPNNLPLMEWLDGCCNAIFTMLLLQHINRNKNRTILENMVCCNKWVIHCAWHILCGCWPTYFLVSKCVLVFYTVI